MTLTNNTLIPPLEPAVPRALRAPADELSEDIVARPLTLPDFVLNIQPYLKNQGLSARWMFTDRRRYSMVKAQGWRNAVKADFKEGFAALNPYETEGGTKYINGDLILMLIDRRVYLGALKYKHQVAAALSDSAVQRRLSAEQASGDLGEQVAAVNRQRMAQGRPAVMDVFTPGAADISKTPLGDPKVAAKELGRIGGTRDIGGAGVSPANDSGKTT